MQFNMDFFFAEVFQMSEYLKCHFKGLSFNEVLELDPTQDA